MKPRLYKIKLLFFHLFHAGSEIDMKNISARRYQGWY